jgi:hypothetical protein
MTVRQARLCRPKTQTIIEVKIFWPPDISLSTSFPVKPLRLFSSNPVIKQEFPTQDYDLIILTGGENVLSEAPGMKK